MAKLWQSEEQSFSVMKREYGEPILMVALLKELSDMAAMVGAELNKVQFNFIINEITTKYHYFTISDLTIIGNRIAYEKVYHKPSIQTFLVALKEYDLERDEYAALNQKKQQSEAEEETKEDIERFQENYKKMYRNANKPRRSNAEIQKSKDKQLQRKRDKFIKKLREQYPDESK
jgi:hypothetical protein